MGRARFTLPLACVWRLRRQAAAVAGGSPLDRRCPSDRTQARSGYRQHIARDERGAAIVEAAIVVPLVLLIVTGIFDLGRAYQTYQVLSNAAREGARVSVVPGGDETKARQVVQAYMESGGVPAPSGQQTVDIDVNREATITLESGDTVGATQVTIQYPYEFMVLGPIARLVSSGDTPDDAFTMQVTSVMRNESM